METSKIIYEEGQVKGGIARGQLGLDTAKYRLEKAKFGYEKGMNTFTIIKWLFTSSILLWLFLGPGILIGVLTLKANTPWPVWILLIFIGIMLWRD